MEWGEYKLGDLFDVKRGKRLTVENRINGNRIFVTAGYEKCGIAGYINNQEQEIFPANTITIDMFANTFYRNYEFSADDNILVLLDKNNNNSNGKPFIVSMINKILYGKFDYGKQYRLNSFEKTEISLPTKDGKIDFDFMESFIEDLENERINKLNNYLQETGLNNYILTSEEEKILADCESGKFEWGEFRLGDLFEKIKVKSLKYKTSELPSEPTNEYNLPALTAGIINQGLNNFVPKENATILKNVISISANGANTGATFYQNKEFTVLQDAYAIKYIYTDDILTDNQYLYLTETVSNLIYGKYDWSNKAGWEKIKNHIIQLPTKNNTPNYELMETLISAVQKLVIKDVVKYVEKKLLQ